MVQHVHRELSLQCLRMAICSDSEWQFASPRLVHRFLKHHSKLRTAAHSVRFSMQTSLEQELLIMNTDCNKKFMIINMITQVGEGLTMRPAD